MNIKLQLEEGNKLFNPHTIFEFLYQFSKNFDYEIVSVDAVSECRTFSIRYLYYKNDIQKNAKIDYDSFNAEIIYELTAYRVDELNLKRMFTIEVDFIKSFL